MSAYQSFMTVLGWSLLSSIWQMSVLWVIYYCLRVTDIRISAAGKHNLILVFVFIGTEWFIYTFVHMLEQPLFVFTNGFIPVSISVNSCIYGFSIVYIGVLFFRISKYLVQSRGHQINKIAKIFSPNFQSFTDRNARILGITRRVQVYVSDLAETAQTSGFLKPFILLPVSLVTCLTPSQVEAILIHELFHIRRNDYFINICMSCFRIVFFFNPFARLFYKALERERELACDDGVIEMGFAPDQYAEALFCLEKFRQVHPGFHLAADGNKPWFLMERICRLLGKPSLKKNRFNPLIALSLIASVLLLGLKVNTTLPNRVKVPVPDIRHTISKIQFAFDEAKIVHIEKITNFKRTRKWKSEKPIKIKSDAELTGMSSQTALINPLPQAKLFYASDRMARNFSNQQASALSQAAITASPNSPYLPSVTLSYEAVPEIVWQDSIREVVVQNNFEDLKNLNQIKAIAKLEALESEIEKNADQLKEIEKKNRSLILMDQGLVKPLLNDIHRQIKLKKQKIDQLKAHLEISEQEIIHI